MPRPPAPIRNKQKQNRKKSRNKAEKISERRRKPQKEHRTPIRPPQMYKKIIMQKNMQKINSCRHGMQLFVDMP